MSRPDAGPPQPPAPRSVAYARPGDRPPPDVFAGYARMYAAFAVLTVVLSFQPLFVRVDSETGVVAPMLSLWDELAETGHQMSMLAVMFFIALTALLAVGAFGVRSVAVAIGIVVAAVILVVLILARPGYGDPTPELSSWGQIGVVLGFAGVVVAAAHALHLALARRPARG